MKRIILEPTDVFRVLVGDSMSLELNVETIYKIIGHHKKIDNSNLTYQLIPKLDPN